MKKLVGQREEVDLGMKEAMLLLSIFTVQGPKPNQIVFTGMCVSGCGETISLTLTEEAETGNIWAEGPDVCRNCNYQVSDPNSGNEMLSQKEIKYFFGEF